MKLALVIVAVLLLPSTAKAESYAFRYKHVRHVLVVPHNHYKNLLCIHGGEGSWTDPNAPYYGGLQMDLGFQRTYGRWYLNSWGTADHWAPFVQIYVAYRAIRSGRGYYPWPNTGRACGLL